jgi:diaminohydroxyphosphoribosylaminopyrimidine deaminase/5-amino-6-(5-phosphoribosylamino)uracil reductase
MVGALVVDTAGTIVGAGFHARAGTPHAEVHALRAAGDQAKGATLYSTLEPCAHVGRTDPCVEAIAAAGVRRVVSCTTDPNPLVAGKGFEYLRAHGIDVTSGTLEDEAERLNEVFFTNMRRQRPFVIAKIAMGLDGAVASAPGRRTRVTSRDAERHAHRTRAEVDAVAIGSETALVDDPLLTPREVFRERPLVRIVFDARLRTRPDARLFGTLDAGPVWIVTRAVRTAGDARVEALRQAGATLVEADPHDLAGALSTFYTQGIGSILFEGGSRLHGSAWQADVIDRVHMYVAPQAFGAQGVHWEMPPSFSVAALHRRRVSWLGEDCLIEGDVYRSR